MDTTILEDIGLTGAEIKVFITLLELGSTSAGKVVEKSNLQNAVVHRAFHSLTQKGIITHIFFGRIKHYQAIDPKLLLNFLDEKKAKLEKLLPELEAKRDQQVENPKAIIFQGIKGVKELLNLMIDTESKNFYEYGGPKKANELLGEHFWEAFHKKRISKKINAKLLFHSSIKKWGDFLKTLKHTQVRITDKDFEGLTETIICGNKVGIIIWSDKPFGFLIEEQLASSSYKNFAKILWEQAK